MKQITILLFAALCCAACNSNPTSKADEQKMAEEAMQDNSTGGKFSYKWNGKEFKGETKISQGPTFWSLECFDKESNAPCNLFFADEGSAKQARTMKLTGKTLPSDPEERKAVNEEFEFVKSERGELTDRPIATVSKSGNRYTLTLDKATFESEILTDLRVEY